MSQTITRRTFTGFAIAAGGALVAACSSGGGNGGGGGGGSADGELETTSISLGLRRGPGYTMQMVAIEKGFLEDAGFTDISTSQYDAGAQAGEALAAGELNLWATATMPPVSMRHNGVPIVIVATAATGPGIIEKLVVRDDATIETPEDLTKIKIGALAGSTADSCLANLEELNGLEPNSLQKVNLAPADQLVALANDEVQGILTWNPFPEQFRLRNPEVPVTYIWENNTSYFPWADGEEMKGSNARLVFCLREDWITANPNSAAAMMQAMFEAQAWVADPANRDEAIEMYLKYFEEDRSIIETTWDFNFDPTLDQAYVDDVNAYTDVAMASGAISGDRQDPLSYTYTGLLEDYDPSKVQVEGGWQP
ncbi:MAG: ABC transporter substrate-binding protein [Beutenbergiaceae bacterium]